MEAETVSVASALDAPEAGGQSPGSVLVTSLVRHRADGVMREPGEQYLIAADRVPVNVQRGIIADPYDLPIAWHDAPNRELRVERLDDVPFPAIVACLNIWNDRAALEQTMPTWLPYVDAVVVADGPYVSIGETGASTDGLATVLAQLACPCDVLTPPDSGAWPDQATKRTALMQAAAARYPGAGLFLIDADEFVWNGSALRQLPECDVAWATITSPLYTRPYGQPRIVRAAPGLHYRGRHHWLYRGKRLLATHQYGGNAVEHRLTSVEIHNARGLGHDADRAAQKQRHLKAQRTLERTAVASAISAQSDTATGHRESLRIVQLTHYDPGLVGYRLHTAINTTTPHASLFARMARLNPFVGPSQYDPETHRVTLRQAAHQADVIHCHLDYRVLDGLTAVRATAPVVIHHHGTWYRTHAEDCNAQDAERAAVRLVSNLELLQYGTDLHFLPNPIPVARYRRLRAHATRRTDGVLRIGHSPSQRAKKGTDAFLRVTARLIEQGLPIEVVLIEKRSHAKALSLKATCDLFFDAFDLGIQCSGLEAAAMGIPVIAGDAFVRRSYVEQFGGCPYVFAGGETELGDAISALVQDADHRADAAWRVTQYVESFHDEAVVALRYLDLLDAALGWRTRESTTAPRPVVHAPPAVTAPVAPSPKRQRPQSPKAPKAPAPHRRVA